MATTKTSVCPQCGQEFTFKAYPSWPTQKYCSHACHTNAGRTTTVCIVCGKAFTHKKSLSPQHCSAACRGKTLAKNLGKHFAPILEPLYCEQCGQEITKAPTRKSRFCSQRCFGNWLSKHNRGPNHPMYGKKAKPRPLKGQYKTCPQCGKEFYIKPSAVARRRFCCKACNTAYQREHAGDVSGENNVRWRGGYEPYYGPSWPEQRRKARERDGYACQCCSKTEQEEGEEMNVHHKVAFREFGLERHEEANALSNLTCLCRSCHTIIENHQ